MEYMVCMREIEWMLVSLSGRAGGAGGVSQAEAAVAKLAADTQHATIRLKVCAARCHGARRGDAVALATAARACAGATSLRRGGKTWAGVGAGAGAGEARLELGRGT